MADLQGTLRSFFRYFDQQDYATVLKMVDANAEGSDEITRKWIRGKKAFEAYIKRVGPEISNIKTRLSNIQTRRAGNVGLATYNAVQFYTLSGERHDLKFVASTVFLKRGKNWKMTMIHMTPVGGS
ncbi:MAG TPA: nuclear transport factor 2 family protein [Anaerolineales bacterium]|nr:nuclear transport factor 2 family protein [Anaerolineales bacterium]